ARPPDRHSFITGRLNRAYLHPPLSENFLLSFAMNATSFRVSGTQDGEHDRHGYSRRDTFPFISTLSWFERAPVESRRAADHTAGERQNPGIASSSTSRPPSSPRL